MIPHARATGDLIAKARFDVNCMWPIRRTAEFPNTKRYSSAAMYGLEIPGCLNFVVSLVSPSACSPVPRLLFFNEHSTLFITLAVSMQDYVVAAAIPLITMGLDIARVPSV
jgi:hypothetical protein